jgi:hypothetical protein
LLARDTTAQTARVVLFALGASLGFAPVRRDKRLAADLRLYCCSGTLAKLPHTQAALNRCGALQALSTFLLQQQVDGFLDDATKAYAQRVAARLQRATAT